MPEAPGLVSFDVAAEAAPGRLGGSQRLPCLGLAGRPQPAPRSRGRRTSKAPFPWSRRKPALKAHARGPGRRRDARASSSPLARTFPAH